MFTFNLHIFGLHLIEPTLRFDSLIFHLLRRLPYHRGNDATGDEGKT